MDGLNKVRREMKGFIAERDWKKFHEPKNLALSVCIEAAELLEHFQWKNKAEMEAYLADNKNKEEVADEIADVAMYLFELADDLGIDIYSAISSKIKKNKKKYPVNKVKGRAVKYSKL